MGASLFQASSLRVFSCTSDGGRQDSVTRYVTAAYLHDIGKLANEELRQLFSLERKFTPGERRLAQEHAQAGISMLDPSVFFDLLGFDEACVQVTKQGQVSHHIDFGSTMSRRDFELLFPGVAYRELRGKQLPLAGRIIAVPDVFDALTFDRKYKRTWSTEDAAAYLVRHQGRWFDADIVKLFVDMVLPWPLTDKSQISSGGHGCFH
jgi:putative two-component system response regulator